MLGLPTVATRLILMALFLLSTYLAGYEKKHRRLASTGLLIGLSILLLLQWMDAMNFTLITKVY